MAPFYPKSIKVIICYSNNNFLPPLLTSEAVPFLFPSSSSPFHSLYRLESAIYVLQFNLTSRQPLAWLPKPLRYL